MKILAIISAKIIILIGKICNRGTSLPGEIALKIDKKIITKLKLPKTIVAVTGSSGKGSTSSMIAYTCKQMGYKVVHNISGANLKPGIVTTLIENSTWTGRIKGDILIYEMDERYAKFVFPELEPRICCSY